MYYKILNSSIGFKDNKYYIFTSINYIAERLFNKKSDMNKINFIVEYKNNKIIKYISKKNNKNVIITKEIINKKNGGKNSINEIVLDKVFNIINNILNDESFIQAFTEKIYQVFNSYLKKNPEIITNYLLDPIIELINKYKNKNKKIYYFGGVKDIFNKFHEQFANKKKSIVHSVAYPIINKLGDYSIILIKNNILEILNNENITDKIIKEVFLDGIIKKLWKNKVPKILNLRSDI